MSRRTPNDEQRLAIEHHGGVLLSAGAGSGKTFVLIEHIIYLINSFHLSNTDLGQETFRRELKQYLSGIVLMTFTKKAAGELGLRLNRRLESEKEYSDKKWVWDVARDCIGSLTVGTIHGFCFKLLSQGFFNDFDPSVRMLNDVETLQKIENLYHLWFDKTVTEEKLHENSFIHNLLANESSIIFALLTIFSDPELRIMWSKLDPSTLAKSELGEFFSDYSRVGEFQKVLTHSIDLSPFSGSEKKSWYQFLEKYEAFRKGTTLSDLESLDNWNKFFGAISRMPSVRKTEGLPEAVLLFDQIKKFREFVKSYYDDIKSYFENPEVYITWAKGLKEIFDYIDTHYKVIPGVTFSDLEYFVFKGLESLDAQKRVARSYKYIIVDEFQDTSEIQFQIIRRIIQNDFTRLFCVGDVKQAIYGFRGGELGVFLKCSKLVPKNLSLTNNYRSQSRIINLNNFLFNNLFKKGLGFDGQDQHSVEVEYQTVPEHMETGGALYKLTVSLDETEKGNKPGPSEIDQLEADALFKHILEFHSEFSEENICVLYRKLNPSKYLVRKLIENGIPFSAQMKVPLSEDPLIGIFYLLLEYMIDAGKGNVSAGYGKALLDSYCHFLGIRKLEDVETHLNQFIVDWNTYGPLGAFQKFIYSARVNNSNHTNNMQIITSICENCEEEPERAWSLLKSHLGDLYSIEFHHGSGNKRIFIMTAHASKGLQFDHVLLGGIHTNGIRRGDKGYFGKGPGSYKWKTSTNQKKPFKSPYFLLENLINTHKEFAESKRLFYVACTRAVSRLGWVDLSYAGKPLGHGDGSWINGFRSWENDIEEESIEIREFIKQNSTQADIERENDEQKLKLVNNGPPLFHIDSLGIIGRDAEKQRPLGIAPELSVTRFASVIECPRKFYLRNICKFDEDMKLYVVGDDGHKMSKEDYTIEEENYFETEVRKSSSAERGTKIHESLSKLVKSNLEISMDDMEPEELSIHEWVKDKLRPLFNDYELISEEPVKFPLFGYMISGTPDLLLSPTSSDSIYQIWDFKTGYSNPEKERPYWFQLYCYAYAAFVLERVSRDSVIELSLVYVDEKRIQSLKVNFDEVIFSLSEAWSKTSSLDQVNTDHCNHCLFGKLCLEGTR